MKFLASNDKAMKPVQAIRARIEETRAELARLDHAPLPLADVEARIDDWLSRKQYLATGRMLALDFASPGAAPAAASPSWDFGGQAPAAFNLMDRVLTLLANLAPAELRHNLLRLVAEHCPDPGPPLAERPALARKLQAKLLALEIDEEREIEKLEDEGWLVHRRADARPEVILSEPIALKETTT